MSLTNGDIRWLMPGMAPQYVNSGHLVYVERDGSLFAQPFDVTRRDTVGARRIVQGVSLPGGPSNRPLISVSESGAFAYPFHLVFQTAVVLHICEETYIYQHARNTERKAMGNSADRFLPLKPKVFLVLLTLHDRPQHGYGIKTAIKKRTEGAIDLDPGGMYRLIGRLEDQGLVAPTPAGSAAEEQSGDDPRRRYYELTSLGRIVVRAEARRLTDLVANPEVAALAAETGR